MTLKHSQIYSTWKAMKARCFNPKNRGYRHYGGRGIRVCKRWMKFENFLADMGERPAGLQIDRIDNDGNYEPGNCRWATPLENALNTRWSRRYTFKGKTNNISGWARMMGITSRAMRHRVNFWPLEQALTAKPIGNNATKTQCPLGHAFDKTTSHSGGGTFRYCSICSKARARARYAKKHAEQRTS